jgi:hypothetical protein
MDDLAQMESGEAFDGLEGVQQDFLDVWHWTKD